MDFQAESPELWEFLGSLRHGELLSGTVASIESFGVFVSLDDGPPHPIFPGVGFVTVAELTWRHIEAISDAVQVGQRVTGEFLQFDTHNAEARLSLKALRPDPFQAFADRTEVGRIMPGVVTKVAPPLGVFVRVEEGIEGLIRIPEEEPGDRPQPGEELTVVVAMVDRQGRRLLLHPA
ncbi:S1 RNA-binding domain-containing protein [Streptomyces mesophilus]|uniref:S1 RNA-binding domain-containing protein n=1 Tax=Streptomyces mesophilus TaxID=1775132 RepID=UPI003331539E